MWVIIPIGIWVFIRIDRLARYANISLKILVCWKMAGQDKDKTKDQLILELTELRGMLQELQETRQQLQAVADYTPNVEHWVGPDGKLLWVNPRVSDVTGYSVEECLAMQDFPIPIIHEADRERRKRLFIDSGQASRSNKAEFRIVCKDGRHKWVGLSWRAMYAQNGAHLGWRYSIHDITNPKRLANELRKTNRILGLAQDVSETGIWTMDIRTGEVTWSNALYRLFGLSPAKEKASRETWRRLFHPEDRERTEKIFNDSLNRKVSRRTTYRIVLPSGEIRWILSRGNTVYDEAGKSPLMVGICMDITEQKNLEDELRKTNQMLGLAQEASGAGIWTIDLQTGKVHWSDALYRLFGLSPTKDEASQVTWSRLIHPEDRERTEKMFTDSLCRKKNRRSDYRIILSSGEIRWIYTRGNTILDDTGISRFMVGICIDITEHKQKEEEIKKHRKNLEMLVKNRTAELEKKTLQLEETITTLRFLLNQRQKDRNEIQENIMANVNQLVVPFIDKLKINCSDKTEASCLDVLENNLQNIVSSFSNRLAFKNLKFTPSELQVSNLIREGKSTKEIANILNLSVSTIQFHRDNIRKKLDLNKTNQKLSIYLRSLS